MPAPFNCISYRVLVEGLVDSNKEMARYYVIRDTLYRLLSTGKTHTIAKLTSPGSAVSSLVRAQVVFD